MIDGGVHCLFWMDTEECLQHKGEEAERRRHRNQDHLQFGRAAMTAEQRRIERTRNVQVSTSTWGLVCVVTHSLTWMTYLSWQASLEYRWDHFLHFEQQLRGSAYWHALSLVIMGKPGIVKTYMNGTGEAWRRMMTRMTMDIALSQIMMSWWLT